ncbi:MAG: shikimate dehydrogenase [bacterium]|nr:shikimate dehydrogenase [bacterium]
MEESRLENSQLLNSEAEITAQRRRIDDIDDQILELVGKRLAVARKIGRIKQQDGITVVDNQRESEIYQRLLSLNPGTLKSGSLYRIFRGIIAAGRSVQKSRNKVGVLPLYGVFGNPVGHSLSPVMHNSALAQTGLDGYYFAFIVEDIAAAVSGIRGLGIRGASVTIPHKISVMKYLDQVDPPATEIGAVNTILNHQGVLHGSNSDCAGAIKALIEKTSINGKDVAVVGAGGGARAVGFGIKQEGGRLTIINRTPDRGEKLASDLNCEFIPFPEVNQLPYDIVINATSAGMAPHDDSVPFSTDLLKSGMVVMDMVYNPLKTRFLADAEKKGCTTVDGLAMFVHQGAVQFELWTGEKAPLDIMRKVVIDELLSR